MTLPVVAISPNRFHNADALKIVFSKLENDWFDSNRLAPTRGLSSFYTDAEYCVNYYYYIVFILIEYQE